MSEGRFLFVACEDGNLEIAQWLIDNGANINNTDDNQHTPLFHACRTGDIRVAKWILKNGADIDHEDRLKQTPLFDVCRSDRLEMVQWLVQNGADIHHEDLCKRTALRIACEHGCIKILRWLIKNGGANIHHEDEIIQTPLFDACHPLHDNKEECFETITILLENGADINHRNGLFETPLFVACHHGETEIVTLLLQNGADINATSFAKQTPLFYMCDLEKDEVQDRHLLDIVKLLIKNGAKIDHCENRSNQSPLCRACCNGNFDIVKHLVENGANVHHLDSRQQTPLHYACQYGDLEMVKWLVENGADVYCEDNDERTPLFAACLDHYVCIVRWLVNEKCCSIHRKDKDELSLLQYALLNIEGYIEQTDDAIQTITFLLEKGAVIGNIPYQKHHFDVKRLFNKAKNERADMKYLRDNVSRYPTILVDAPQRLQHNHDILLLALGISIDIIPTGSVVSSSLGVDAVAYYLQHEHYNGHHAFIRHFHSMIQQELNQHKAFVSVFMCGVFHQSYHHHQETVVIQLPEKKKFKKSISDEDDDDEHQKTCQNKNVLPLLNHCSESLPLIAAFAGIPVGEQLKQLRNADRNIERWALVA